MGGQTKLNRRAEQRLLFGLNYRRTKDSNTQPACQHSTKAAFEACEIRDEKNCAATSVISTLDEAFFSFPHFIANLRSVIVTKTRSRRPNLLLISVSLTQHGQCDMMPILTSEQMTNESDGLDECVRG